MRNKPDQDWLAWIYAGKEPGPIDQHYISLGGGVQLSTMALMAARGEIDPITVDGKPTKIKRVTRTNGRPRYIKTVDVFVCLDDTFDVLATKGVGLQEWLIAHMPAETSEVPNVTDQDTNQ